MNETSTSQSRTVESTKDSNVADAKPLTFDGVTRFYVLCLRTIGILPFSGRDYNFTASRILLLGFILASFVNCIMFVRYCLKRLNQGIVEPDNICEVILVLGTVLRYLLLIPRRAEVLELIDDCREIWDRCSTQEHQIVRLFERRVWSLCRIFICSCLFTNILYTFTAITVRLPPLEPNGTERRILPFRWFTNDDEISWLGYEVVLVLQVIIVQTLGVVSTSVDAAAPFLMMISCGFFKALQSRLFLASARIKPSVDREIELYQEFIGCVKFHQRILELCMKIEKLTRTLFLVQLLGTGYNLSLAGLKLSGSDPDRFKFIPLFGMCLGQLFICQWAPDYLLEESEAVAAAVYFNAFTLPRPRIMKLLMIILKRAQRPVQMTAGGIVTLSIETFGSMITSAISFFTVLRSFGV